MVEKKAIDPDIEHISIGESDGTVARIPLRYLTRHGIIAGSTGTGKSRAMQVMAEQLADGGVDVFVSDVKGDASGFCVEGAADRQRNALAQYEPHAIKTDYWSVGDRFAALRFRLCDVGPVLFSRLLSLNPTQESHLALAFSYAKKNGRELDTIAHLQDVLDRMVETKERGISPSSISVIQRKLTALGDSGLHQMFGRPGVERADLQGLNVLNLSDARKDMSASIAPAFLLNKLFNELPEVGEQEKPVIAVFFDEAHYLFKDANRSLRDLMVTILKQIRSKGVAVFFVTQDVTDLPEEILSQLSTKIIFSQKTLTEKGNARLRALAKSFPISATGDQNGILETLKTMPPGTALISTLDDSGNQTEPKVVRVFAPATSMEVLGDDELRAATDPKLIAKYARNRTSSRAKPIPKIPKHETSNTKPGTSAKPETMGRLPQVPKVLSDFRTQNTKPVIQNPHGPSAWDTIFGFLLKLLDFILKATGRIADFLLIKPLRSLFKYLVKKPARIVYFLLFLLLLYFIYVNWTLIASLLGRMRLP